MPVVLLILTVLSATVQNFFAKIFSTRTDKGVFLFNAMSAFVALLIFIVMAKFQFTFVLGNLLYILLFALSYFFAVFGLTMAIKTGPLSITALIESYSMIVASVYGILFLNEPITTFMLIGFGLLIVSLTLVNYEKKEKTQESEEQTKKNNGISLKWIIFVSIGFVGNGFCTVVQKMQQVWSEKTYGVGQFLYSNEMMIGGLLLAVIAFIVCSFIMERKDVKEVLQKGWAPAVGRGLSNGLANLFSILVMTMMSVSIANAVIAAGCVILAALISVLIYKEKLNAYQLIGVGIGVASLIFLNL